MPEDSDPFQELLMSNNECCLIIKKIMKLQRLMPWRMSKLKRDATSVLLSAAFVHNRSALFDSQFVRISFQRFACISLDYEILISVFSANYRSWKCTTKTNDDYKRFSVDLVWQKLTSNQSTNSWRCKGSDSIYSKKRITKFHLLLTLFRNWLSTRHKYLSLYLFKKNIYDFQSLCNVLFDMVQHILKIVHFFWVLIWDSKREIYNYIAIKKRWQELLSAFLLTCSYSYVTQFVYVWLKGHMLSLYS